jgi:maleylpyruvate isomerase
LILYDYWRSSAAHRVRIGLNLKGLAHTAEAVNLAPGKEQQFGDAYRAVNPQARIPALKTDAGVLTQSLAILEWLDEIHPDPAFLPRDPWTRAQVRAFALLVACDIHPLTNTAVSGRLKAQFGAGDEALGDWRRHWIALGLAALEAQLTHRPRSSFAFGAQPTLADICLVPQMASARRFQVDLSAFPRLLAVDANALALPAFATAAPENQKDATRS